MANATQDLKLYRIGVPTDGQKLNFPLAAAAKIYGNTIAATNTSGQLVSGASFASTSTIWGVVDRQTDNTAGAACALSADVNTGIFAFFNCGGSDLFTQANVGATVYANDDTSVGSQALSRPKAGILACVAGIGQGVGLPNQFVGVIMQLGGAVHT